MSNVSILLSTHFLFFTSSLISSLLFYLWSRPPRLEVLATFIAAVLVAFRLGLAGVAYAKVMIFLCYWGVVALVVSFFVALTVSVIVPVFSREQVTNRVSVLEYMVAPPLFQFLASVVLGLLNRWVPHTLDYCLYAFDASLGFQPGWLGADLLGRLTWLRSLAECAYMNLTLAMSFSYLILRTRSVVDARAFLRFVVLLGFAGFPFYVVFPAVGTEVLFPGGLPQTPPAVSTISVDQTPDLREPRNCMPSLHTAWGLALWWTCPRNRWCRAGIGIYLCFMLLYTLSCGHYLADMIAAVPFALAVYAVTKTSSVLCRRSALISLAVFMTWLLLLSKGTGLFLFSPIVPWTMIFATLAFCYVFRRRVERDVVDSLQSGTMCAPSQSVVAV